MALIIACIREEEEERCRIAAGTRRWLIELKQIHEVCSWRCRWSAGRYHGDGKGEVCDEGRIGL